MFNVNKQWIIKDPMCHILDCIKYNVLEEFMIFRFCLDLSSQISNKFKDSLHLNCISKIISCNCVMKCSISHFMKTSKFTQNDQNLSIGALCCKYVISLYECAISSLKTDMVFEKLNLSEHQLYRDKGVHFMWTNAHIGTYLALYFSGWIPSKGNIHKDPLQPAPGDCANTAALPSPNTC